MVSTFTPNLGLEKPGDGDADWGTAWNSNADTLDTQITGAQQTLDDSYDQGGAGAGRTITTDSGAVELDLDGTDGVALEVTQTDSAATTNMINVNHAGTGHGININHTTGGTQGRLLNMSSNASSSTDSLVKLDMVSSPIRGLWIDNSGGGSVPTELSITGVRPTIALHNSGVTSTTPGVGSHYLDMRTTIGGNFVLWKNEGVSEATFDWAWVEHRTGGGIDGVNKDIVFRGTPAAGAPQLNNLQFTPFGQMRVTNISSVGSIDSPDALMELLQSDASSTDPTLEIINSGEGDSITINHDGTQGSAINITNHDSSDPCVDIDVGQASEGVQISGAVANNKTLVVTATNLGGPMVQFDNNNDLASTCLRIDNNGASQSADVVQIFNSGSGKYIDTDAGAGGAELTNGGTWTDGCSVHIKENFEDVDGAEILDKIEALTIQKWNYISDREKGVTVRMYEFPQNEKTITDILPKHITPFAEEFLETFGLGESSKSLWQGDTAGVALAAIKELIKRNKELEARLAALEGQ